MNPLDLGKRAILEHQALAHSARALRTPFVLRTLRTMGVFDPYAGRCQKLRPFAEEST